MILNEPQNWRINAITDKPESTANPAVKDTKQSAVIL